MSAVNQPDMSGNSAERAGRYTATIVIHLLVWVWMVKIYREARRHAMLRASEVVHADPRAAVLYLRSFKDDRAIRVRARATNGRIPPGAADQGCVRRGDHGLPVVGTAPWWRLATPR